MQLMTRVRDLFHSLGVSAYLRPYGISVTARNAGLIEYIADSISLDALKKKLPKGWTLRRYYEEHFGRDGFEEAQRNFVQSLAGYSLFNFVFSVKDRHNGNILMIADGHLVHIDFGFMFQTSPGGWAFEKAPFKLTPEYVEMMDGFGSHMMQYFKSLLISGFH